MSDYGREDETFLETARRRFAHAVEYWAAQRKREEEDLRFQVAENQWSGEVKTARKGRPVLSISLLNQPMQLVQAQMANAKLGVNIHPVSEKTDDDQAEVRQNLYRRIERDSNADQARQWAFDRAKKCGIGWYRISTQWDEDGDNPFDQEIVIERIIRQESVYMDPAAQKADFSDAEYAFLASWIPRDTFRRLYPQSEACGTNFEWAGWAETTPEWVRAEDVLVAEYWYKVHSDEEVKFAGRTRRRDKVTCHWSKITGFETLEQEPTPGSRIPLVPVVWNELQPYDKERRFEGMIRPARDGQMLFNFAASTLVERMSMEPKTPWVGAEGQFEGHPEWDSSNVNNYAKLEYRMVDYQGKPAPPPQRAQLDQTGMSIAMLALQEGKDFVQSATAVYDPSLGKAARQQESGRKVQALQQQADAGTSQGITNMATISMPYESAVILEWQPVVYDRSGRITHVLGDEDETQPVMLGKPFVNDPNTGKPVPAQPGQPGVKHYDLSKGGKYAISISVGKSFQTRSQQGSEMIGQIITASPELMPLLGPSWLTFTDIPGHKEMADVLKRYRDKMIPGVGDDPSKGPTPEQAQAQVQALQAQLQQTQQQFQLAVQEIKTDQAKQQAQIFKAQIDAQKEIQLQTMRDATSIEVAQINARAKGVLSASEASNEAIALARQHAFETAQADKDREHERMLAAHDAAHEVGMGAAGGNTMEMQTEQGQEGEQEQGQETGTEDAPAPAPMEGGA